MSCSSPNAPSGLSKRSPAAAVAPAAFPLQAGSSSELLSATHLFLVEVLAELRVAVGAQGHALLAQRAGRLAQLREGLEAEVPVQPGQGGAGDPAHLRQLRRAVQREVVEVVQDEVGGPPLLGREPGVVRVDALFDRHASHPSDPGRRPEGPRPSGRRTGPGC